MPRFFPVAGDSVNANDFGFERAGRGGHQGVDIFASEGTPLVAVDAGTVRFGTDPLGGNVANLYSSDGSHYYYAHLSAFEGASNRRVAAGEVIGFVGTTGNARGTRPHVHFEVHPCATGRCAVDPSPVINPLPRADRATGGSGGLAPKLRLVALLGLGGATVWAALNPSRARQIIGRYV